MPGNQFSNPRYMLVGDPGFFSLLGKIAKPIASIATGFLPGGGLVRTGIKGIAGTLGAVSGAKVLADTVSAGSRLVLAAPTATRAIGTATRMGGITRAGTAVAGIGALGAGAAALLGGGEKKRRHLNPLNPSALRRATRRLHGFNSFARRTERALRRIAPARHARPCAPRRKPCR